MADSEVIDKNILSFKYDYNEYDCIVRIPEPFRSNERFFIKDQSMLADNYPVYQGKKPVPWNSLFDMNNCL